MIRKDVIPNSTERNLRYRKNLLSNMEYIPNIAEVAWGLATYKEIRNIWLLPYMYTRTSSVDSDNECVIVGGTAADSIFINGISGEGGDPRLGQISARKHEGSFIVI